MDYSNRELKQLHSHLYIITAEIIRICNKYGLRYFVIGGSALGVYYWNAIIPWDDDIDIGMPRKDYERFLQIAPNELDNHFFLQWLETDCHTPFWFAKVRENNTLFIEGHFKSINMHHGIFVDIFPFDLIPNNKFLERIQYNLFGFFHACFIGKEIWQWSHCGKCEVEAPLERNFFSCLCTRIIVLLLSKKHIYQILRFIQTFYSEGNGKYYKNIMTKTDKVRISDVLKPRLLKFGPLEIPAPQDLQNYLLGHYGHIAKYISKENRINHKPYRLKF